MERAGDSEVRKRDDDDVFGEFMAIELQSIKDPVAKRRIKFQFQSLLFNAQVSSFSPGASQPFILPGPASGVQWDRTPPPRQWYNPPFRPPSTSSLNDERAYGAECD